jgi:hypothetical protein
MSVPKILHQIWLGPNPLPEREAAWAATWREHYPAWEHREWREADLPALAGELLCGRMILDRSLNPGLRSDLLRYELLRLFGGMYADYDIEALANYEEHFEPESVHFHEEREGWAGNGWIVSPRGHPFITTICQRLARETRAAPAPGKAFDHYVFEATGPKMFRRAIHWWLNGNYEHREIHRVGQCIGRAWQAQLVTLFRPIFDPRNEGERERAAGIHHYAGAWKTRGRRSRVSAPVAARSSVRVDVAWMLGSGSEADDWELRMSLRSFRRHYHADAQLWIIGHIPDWIDRSQVRCVPWPDPYSRNKDANLLAKAARLAMEPELSDPFILCSDDHLLVRDSRPEDFRHWHTGEIGAGKPGEESWAARLTNTGRVLRAAGLPARAFEGHIPYPLRKEWCQAALRFAFGEGPGMTIFSTLLNAARVESEPLDSARIRGWLGGHPSAEVVREKSEGNQFVCLDGKSLGSAAVVEYFERRFVAAGPWELRPHRGPMPAAVTPPEVAAVLARLAAKLPPGREATVATTHGEFVIRGSDQARVVTVGKGYRVARAERSAAPGGDWGPPLWREAHSQAAILTTEQERRDLVASITDRLPPLCDCRRHWRAYLAAHPSAVGSVEEFVHWWWSAHNAVRMRQGKAELALDDARRLYQSG